MIRVILESRMSELFFGDWFKRLLIYRHCTTRMMRPCITWPPQKMTSSWNRTRINQFQKGLTEIKKIHTEYLRFSFHRRFFWFTMGNCCDRLRIWWIYFSSCHFLFFKKEEISITWKNECDSIRVSPRFESISDSVPLRVGNRLQKMTQIQFNHIFWVISIE